ncbi:MAG TPA: RNA methyltransferase [Thermoanaerobaculia bacterium]|jgi:TrmH family RNA methyltransferase|nr:RNA methyltransferase [Thermoanaerobaculia bacterium]
MPRVRIVLVEPREAGNVGAAARVMKNFGFDELWIVGEHPELLPVAGWWASGSDDLLATARFSPTLHDAVADAHLTVATTSMRGRTSPVSFTSKTLAERFASLADDQTLALVFGREDHGLTREELMLCQHTAAISTNDRFPTMNLAQSVGVFCYELTQITPAPIARELPDAASLERVHQRARDLLREVGFLHEDNPDRIYDDLRNLVARADPDAREATILLGIIRQIEWKIRSSNAPD